MITIDLDGRFVGALRELESLDPMAFDRVTVKRRRLLIALVVARAPYELRAGLQAAFKACVPDLPAPLIGDDGEWSVDMIKVRQYLGECFIGEAGHA